MERRSGSWKANRDTEEAVVVTPPAELLDYARRAMTHLGADIPGLTGFPESVRDRLAARLTAQLA
ncbi:hypothetical protein [Deinococcus sp. SL84]|uniref:hypothetical protein n=1 Tax=Deinococcus sp. SL84 TaxID=2994663 RepID=UPI00227449A8|nr:hypothetical protein [Deinococcus sp. SL84]MCY1701495.1 hypothetical protein [Deinococcus sp. SL84]